ncbi:MAG TPA: class I SAM-dependent methyltransferase [Bacillales bacterium]
MENIFKNTARFYDIDQHPAQNKDIPFYLQQASLFGSPILELACGTGRVTLPLAKAGFSVYGLDLSQEMLSIFEQKLQGLPRETQEKITICQGEMTEFSFATTFKMILIPFHSFQALSSDEEARKCLARVYSHLDKDGVFILNVSHFNADFAEDWQTGLETQESAVFLEDGQWVTRYTTLQELDEGKRLMTFDNLYRVSGTEKKIEEYRDRLQIRYYEEHDLRQLLDEAGFEITEGMGWYDGTPIENGDEFILICRKKEQ